MRKYISHQALPTLADILAQRESIAALLASEPVDLVLVHGSVAKGKTSALSDLDVAILFTGSSSLRDQVRIMDKISAGLGFENIDFTILNRSSPLLAMQVLIHGICLYEKEGAPQRFRYRAITRYLATKHLRTQFNRYLDAAIARRVLHSPNS